MDKNNGLVSIVTPAYNAARYVGETIESVQAQDYGNWELLIADDLSTDDTAGVVAQYARNDPRVRLLRQAVNGGPAAARNASVQAAQGRYIAFLDADDTWLPGKLSRQLDFMAGNGAAVSYTAFRRVDADGREAGHLIVPPATLSYRQLLGNTAIATSTVIVDRQQTGPFSLRKTYYDDFVLWLELLGRGFVAHGLLEDLMRYRVLTGSVSRRKGRSAKMVWKTYREILGFGIGKSGYFFAQYACNAARKYRRF